MAQINGYMFGQIKIYEPGEVPSNPADLPLYLKQEFDAIADAVREVLSTYSPPASVALGRPSTPVLVSTTPADITGYQVVALTAYAEAAGLIVDAVNGTVTIPGDPDDVFFDISVSVFTELDVTGVSQNTTIYIAQSENGDISQGLLGANYRSENQQQQLIIAGERLYRVYGGDVLKYQIFTDTGSGSVGLSSFQIGINVTNIIADIQL